MPDFSSQTVLIEHAGKRIPVSVTFRQREQLSISVHPDGSVTAMAPKGRSLEEVATHLRRRLAWIVRQQRHFEKYHPLPMDKRYVSGETHLYLGRQYRLRVRQGNSASVRLVGRFFEVVVPTPGQPQAVATAMGEWYQSHAESLFSARMHDCMQTASLPRLGGKIKLQVKPMERRWGSCSRVGMITLNTSLVKMPLHCIDYVIMHELCHLRIHDHSTAFFRLLGRFMPDWKARRQRLESMIPR